MRKELKNSNMEEFIILVEEMRSAQKEYFRTRSATSLNRSKQLEREVDTKIKELSNKQTNLFES